MKITHGMLNTTDDAYFVTDENGLEGQFDKDRGGFSPIPNKLRFTPPGQWWGGEERELSPKEVTRIRKYVLAQENRMS